MTRTIRRCAALAVLAALTLGSSAAEAATADASRACSVGNSRSYGTTYVLSINVRNVRCARAREVVRAFHACRPGKAGRCDRRVLGFRCSESRFNRSSQSYDSRVTCRRGAKVVKHLYTQFL